MRVVLLRGIKGCGWNGIRERIVLWQWMGSVCGFLSRWMASCRSCLFRVVECFSSAPIYWFCKGRRRSFDKRMMSTVDPSSYCVPELLGYACARHQVEKLRCTDRTRMHRGQNGLVSSEYLWIRNFIFFTLDCAEELSKLLLSMMHDADNFLII